jgi:hypothetical protein
MTDEVSEVSRNRAFDLPARGEGKMPERPGQTENGVGAEDVAGVFPE